MGKRSTVVVHYNPNLPNQTLYAEYLAKGFERLSHPVKVTNEINQIADIHVCIGPHYAFTECLGKNTIYIDRCCWGDDLDAVSIGWLRKDGGYYFPTNCPGDRPKPQLKPWIEPNELDKALFLLDYGPYPMKEYQQACRFYSVTLRPHPATGKKQPDLLDHMKGHNVVMGFRTSALVEAAINGYPIISFDKRSSVYPIAGHDILKIKRPSRKQWLNNLSYLQWRGEEIKSGEALEYVLSNHDQAACGTGNAG